MSVRVVLIVVLDLKRRFRLNERRMVVETGLGKKNRILLVDAIDEEIGLLVDEVLQVYRLMDTEIEPPTCSAFRAGASRRRHRSPGLGRETRPVGADAHRSGADLRAMRT